MGKMLRWWQKQIFFTSSFDLFWFCCRDCLWSRAVVIILNKEENQGVKTMTNSLSHGNFNTRFEIWPVLGFFKRVNSFTSRETQKLSDYLLKFVRDILHLKYIFYCKFCFTFCLLVFASSLQQPLTQRRRMSS